MKKSESDRFWAKVQKSDGCWLWTGSRLPSGYGHMKFRGGYTAAHRAAWILTNGPIPDGLHVRHSCDNPPCVNPAHLSTGTALDNARDAMERGRHPRGDAHWTRRDPQKLSRAVTQYLRDNPDKVRRGESLRQSKLTESMVRQIRDLRAVGMTQDELASNFGVAQSTVGRILRRESWSHVA